MTLQEILADPKTFADDIELAVGTEKVKLGDLRTLSTKQQKDLSDKIAAAEKREKEALVTSAKAADLIASIQDAQTKLAAQQKTQPDATDDDFDKSEWWAPVRTRLSERDKKIDSAIAKLDALQTAVTQAATMWAKDRWRQQYVSSAPRLKKVDAYKDWDLDKVLGYATERKILDDDGFPSIERAVADLTKANDLETVRKEAYEEGLKKGKTQARLESMPRPSSATGGKGLPKGKSPVEEFGLEGLGDAVSDDAELMEQISKLGEIETLQ